MMNGCICCTVRQDLIVVLQKLSNRVKAGTLKLDGIIIETTGMADPAPVAQTFFVDDMVKGFSRLDGIVTLVDAKHIEQHLDEEKPEGAENEAVEQVAFADRIILNKTDLVTEDDLTRIEARIKTVNSVAAIQRSQQSNVSVDFVLNVGGFDLNRTLEMDPEFLNTEGEHVHDTSVTSVCISQDGDLDLDMVQGWISELLNDKGADIFRMKGVLSIKHAEQRFVYQAVHMIFNGNFTDPWEADEKRESKLVFIGKNLDHAALRAKMAECAATDEALEAKKAKLRFKVGDKVECNTGGGKWSVGSIVAHLYRDEYMPPGMVAPYQVRLDSGDLIYAPEDINEVIRKAKGAAVPVA